MSLLGAPKLSEFAMKDQADIVNDRSSRRLARSFWVVGIIFSVLAIAGCASNPDYQAQIAAWREVEATRATADAERYRALAKIAEGADAGTKQAALQAWQAVAMVDGLKSGAGRGAADVPQAPPSWMDRGLQLVSAVLPVAAQVAQAHLSTKASIRASDNAVAGTIATMGAFRDTAVSAFDANRATALGLGTSLERTAAAGFASLDRLGAAAIARPAYQIAAGNDATFAIGGNATRTTTNTVNCPATGGAGGNSGNGGNGGNAGGSTGTTAAAAAPGGAGAQSGQAGTGGTATVNCSAGR